MLLYRPLISAYRRSGDRAGRRFILRELASPELHCEPAELIDVLDTSDLSLGDEPARLMAHVALSERLLRLRLTTRDAIREMGGLWTGQATRGEAQSLQRWSTPAPALARAAGDRLGGAVQALLRAAAGPARVLALVATGELGAGVATEPLSRELASGTMQPAAALALGALPADVAQEALVPALQAHGLDRSATWLTLALSRLPSRRSVQLLARLAKSSAPESREHAAWALGFMPREDAAPLLDLFIGERNAHVKLNLVRSIGRLGVPGGRETLRRHHAPSDPELLRVAVIQAAGHSTAAAMTPFLERALSGGSAGEKAEALQALVLLGVPGDAYLDAARSLAASADGRLMLLGLLALTAWAPEEAYGRVRTILSAPPDGSWFLAAYALRYLRTDQTVPLLARLCKTARGSELEEVAVSALCRHLDEPHTLDLLLTCVSADTAPVVIERIMADLAHHLPEPRAPEVAAALRKRIRPGEAPALLGPVLVALGALGTRQDLDRIAPFVTGETAPWAVQALALLMDPAATDLLEPLVERASPEGEAALATLFQLGSPACGAHLERWAARGETLPAACRALFAMALSVRCVRGVSRLAALHRALEEHARTLPENPAPDAASGSVLSVTPPAGTAAGTPLRPVEPPALAPKRARVSASLPSLNGQPPPGSSEILYSDLARHLHLLSPLLPRSRERSRILVGGVVALVAMAAGAWMQAGRSGAGARDRALARTPALFRAGGDPESGAVREGELVEALPGATVTLVTRLRENTLALTGRLKVVGVRFTRDGVPSAELQVSLQEGRADVTFPQGTARVVVPAARTTIEVIGGSSRVETVEKEGSVRLAVQSGQARVLKGPLLVQVLPAGKSGEFRDGNPVNGP